MLEIALPKNYVNLLAGLVSLLFERLGMERAETVQPHPVKAPAAPPQAHVDDLTIINGIGPTFARRLQEAGITTFAALAAAQPDEVKQIARVADWQAVDPAQWIAAAQQMA